MDEAVPPGVDDRRVWYKVYGGRDGVSRKEVSVRENIIHYHGHSAVVCSQFEVDSRAERVC